MKYADNAEKKQKLYDNFMQTFCTHNEQEDLKEIGRSFDKTDLKNILSKLTNKQQIQVDAPETIKAQLAGEFEKDGDFARKLVNNVTERIRQQLSQKDSQL